MKNPRQRKLGPSSLKFKEAVADILKMVPEPMTKRQAKKGR